MTYIPSFLHSSERSTMSQDTSCRGADPPQDQEFDSPEALASELMSQKVPVAEIERQLIEQGLAADAAAQVVRRLSDTRAAARRSAGQRHISYGAIWCLGGA